MTVLLSVLFAVSLAAPAASPAADEPAMAGYFGNTVAIEIPGQWSALRYFKADHTYTQTGSDGDVSGTWAVKDGKVCTSETDAPLDRLPTYCNEGVGRHAGEAWLDHDPVTKVEIRFAIKAGAPSKF